jgi:hypothetical protein
MAGSGTEVTEPDSKPDFDYKRLNFAALSPIVDFIYGAVIGYPLLLYGDLLSPFFKTAASAPVNWVTFTLVSFVFLYSLSDAVETRILTHCFPYTGRSRFSVDLLIALLFFLAFSGASQASPNFLVPFGVIFLMGAVWGVCLHNETKNAFRWRYPKGVILTHVAAGTVWLGYWLSLNNRGVKVLGWPETQRLLMYYVGWLVLTTAGKEFYRVPAVEADLFPTSLIDVAVRKAIKFFREG